MGTEPVRAFFFEYRGRFVLGSKDRCTKEPINAPSVNCARSNRVFLVSLEVDSIAKNVNISVINIVAIGKPCRPSLWKKPVIPRIFLNLRYCVIISSRPLSTAFLINCLSPGWNTSGADGLDASKQIRPPMAEAITPEISAVRCMSIPNNIDDVCGGSYAMRNKVPMHEKNRNIADTV